MRNFKAPISLVGVLILLIVSSFSLSAIEKDPVSSKVTSANTKFGFKLIHKLGEGTGGNIFFSPASISWCLSMVWNGAQGKTKEEMAAALELNGLKPSDVNQAFAAWRNSWAKPDPKVTLQVANSIWARKGFPFRPEFLETNKRFFAAQVSELNFDDPSAVNIINGWVKSNTGGKIEKIIDSVRPESVMFLLNAIYFKGKWTTEFDPALTKRKPFTTGSGKQKSVSMMQQSGNFSYFEQPEFQAVALPYGDRRLSLYLFLPAKDVGLAKFQNALTAENWETWMKGFGEKEGDLSLPRFRVEYEQTLNDPLKALGMRAAFDSSEADFGGMLQTPKASVSEVKHKAFVELNEEGTEAAAVTSVEIQVTSARIPSDRFQMIVNRPFFFAIRDNSTGAVLFLGSIKDPG